ncbi:AAA family ATPase [Risungbinella massiliensis]|uniref:AAA family ATPase n=1 Tax=Risungbinella massiliensis TaxID=1329796 RepID=UPI0005CB8ACA|nr:AAA family ATPase [Risungbinella massiliensis]
MSRFAKLTIENFQSHRFTELTFHPGLNVFVGPSDSGKSAILRALRWVLFNNPRGTEMIRDGANRAQVTLELTDGTKIIRTRGKSINRYTLCRLDQEELVLEGFGSDVPKEIVDAHGIRPIRLEKQEIFLQVGSQLEGPFLLSESGGTKAKVIGMISGAQLIDQAIKGTGTDRNQLQTRSRFLEEQKQSYEAKLTPYEPLEKLGEQLDQLEARYQNLVDLESRLQSLREIQRIYGEIKQEQLTEKSKWESLQRVVELEVPVLEMEKKGGKYVHLHRLASDYKENKFAIQTQKQVLQDTSQVSESQNKLERVIQISELYLKLQQVYTTNCSLQKELSRYRQILDRTSQVSELESRIHASSNNFLQYEKLESLLREWQELQRERSHVESWKHQTESVPHWETNVLPKLAESLIKFQNLQLLQKEYVDTQQSLQVGRGYLQSRIQDIRSYTTEYTNLLKQHGKCPTCGATMNLEAIKILIEELTGGDQYAAAGRTD